MDNLKADMKETPVSNVEKSFIYEAISKAKRTDGRHLDERRNVEIHFGHEFGSCIGLQNILNLWQKISIQRLFNIKMTKRENLFLEKMFI